MTNPSDKKSLMVMAFVFSFVLIGTLLVSYLARGYQFSFKKGPVLTSTGLISATSQPKSASVYVNDRLITATDDTLNLPPGSYQVKISKDGYLPWTKTIQVKNEIVYQTDAQLFRSAPDLKPITFTGAINPAISPDGTKVIYAVASASAAKDNGLYLIELNGSPLAINKNIPRQLASNFPNVDWTQATYEFSPNSRQIIAQFPSSTLLLSLDSPITQKTLTDVTANLNLIKAEWQQQQMQIVQVRLDKLPKSLQPLVSTASSKDIAYSSSEDKILYRAQVDGQIPDRIITPPPAQSTQTQQRQIKKNHYYVYDLEDDTNFLIATDQAGQPQWLPASSSLVFVENESIQVIEYDGTNKQTVFAGKFNPQILFATADGNKIVTLTSGYQGAPENLYAVTIR